MTIERHESESRTTTDRQTDKTGLEVVAPPPSWLSNCGLTWDLKTQRYHYKYSFYTPGLQGGGGGSLRGGLSWGGGVTRGQLECFTTYGLVCSRGVVVNWKKNLHMPGEFLSAKLPNRTDSRTIEMEQYASTYAHYINIYNVHMCI